MNVGRERTGRSWLRFRTVAIGGVLAASLGANVVLAVAALDFYRREQLVRLHPTLAVPAAMGRTAGRAQVLFLGDSRMQAWPDLPKERFVTVNAGGGGETTAQIRLRAAATLDAVGPEVVVLQAGINDLKTIGVLSAAAAETEARCLANLSALVELCRERGARVVLLPILPAAQPSVARRLIWPAAIDGARVRVNAALRKRFDGARGVALLDEHILRADTASDYRDTLHFRPEAYEKLEAAALKAMAALSAQ